VITVVGAIADTLGAAVQWVTVESRSAGRNFDVRREYSSTPSTEYRAVQPAELAVDVNHDGTPIGTVRYLERTASKLYAVCEIDASRLGEGPWAYSPWIRHAGGKNIELLGLSVTRRPAQIGIGHLARSPARSTKQPSRTSSIRTGSRASSSNAPTSTTAAASAASRS
jgi:hypothetical protein